MTKITEFDELAVPALTDFLVVVDDTGGTPVTKHIPMSSLLKIIHALAEETAPATDDEIAIYDAGASTSDRITLANLLLVVSSLPELAVAPDPTADDFLIIDGTTTAKYMNATTLLKVIDALAAITTGYASSDTLITLDGGVPKKTTLANFFAGIEDALAAIGAQPAGSDTLLLIDNGVAKTVTVTNLLAGVGGGGGGQARKSLPVSAAHLPDDSANNAAAQIQKKTSSGGTLHPAWVEALFDDTVDEHVMWSFTMPDNYASAPVVDVYYKAASAVAGTAAFAAAVAAVSDGDAQDVDAKAFDTPNVNTATVPGTAGYLDVISITLTNDDSLAANDEIDLVVFRDVSGDSVSGDLEVRHVVLRYTST